MILEIAIALTVIFFVAVAIFGWFCGLSAKPREDKYNAELKTALEQERYQLETTALEQKCQFEAKTKEIEREYALRLKFIEDLNHSFENSYISGRKWLAEFIGEATRELDDNIIHRLTHKKRPASQKTGDVMKEIKIENRRLKTTIKQLEYQIASYKEYFPFLDDYEEVILDELIDLRHQCDPGEISDSIDPALKYLSVEEYGKLSEAERGQLALERFRNKQFSSHGIGTYYERYIGYQFEKAGWSVEYTGIKYGLKDIGRDLICKSKNIIKIVQAKCWSSSKQIHEKHVLQLYGTTCLYKINDNPNEEYEVYPVLVTSTYVSDVALTIAKYLNVEVHQNYTLDKSYPMIKCNINRATGEKIYHLPFDQQYDRTKIDLSLGELYVSTTFEAEESGFRRAHRHYVTN